MSTSPGNMLSLNVGGVAVNYDLGPSVATVASQAYSFLNNGFTADANLETNAITGAQSLVKSVASPVIDMASTQQQFNDTVLPKLFTQLNQQNFTLGSQALQTQAETAQASIAASNAEAANAPKGGGGGLCFITTAVCDTMQLPDDCEPLRVLRYFRDTYMQATQERRAEVRQYYALGSILEDARLSREGAVYLLREYIAPAVMAIKRGEFDTAYQIYKAMVLVVRSAMHGN